jgi:hypothetical protein
LETTAEFVDSSGATSQLDSKPLLEGFKGVHTLHVDIDNPVLEYISFIKVGDQLKSSASFTDPLRSTEVNQAERLPCQDLNHLKYDDSSTNESWLLFIISETIKEIWASLFGAIDKSLLLGQILDLLGMGRK